MKTRIITLIGMVILILFLHNLNGGFDKLSKSNDNQTEFINKDLYDKKIETAGLDNPIISRHTADDLEVSIKNYRGYEFVIFTNKNTGEFEVIKIK